MAQVTDRRTGAGLSSVWAGVPVLCFVMLFGVFLIFLDLVRGGPLMWLDSELAQIWSYDGPYGMPIADIFDKIGQRTVLLPVLFFVAYRLSRQLGSIRPLVIAMGGSLSLNFIVGVIKLATMRESPRTGGPELFVGNNLFPSGHTSNIVLMLGLTVALMARYGNITSKQKVWLSVGVFGVFVFMTGLSIYRYTHWFTDLLAGGMVGAAVLDLCMRADTLWPALRANLKRLAGPAWPSVERVVARVRPVILRSTTSESSPVRPTATVGGVLTGAGGVPLEPQDPDERREPGVPGDTADHETADTQREPTASGRA